MSWIEGLLSTIESLTRLGQALADHSFIMLLTALTLVRATCYNVIASQDRISMNCFFFHNTCPRCVVDYVSDIRIFLEVR